MDAGRIFYDVSFTRTQSGTVGISRTVRRVFHELERQGLQPVPVGFHSSGFRRVKPVAAVAPSASPRNTWLLKLVGGRLFRRVVTFALHLMPWGLLSRAWAIASTRIFDGMTSDAEPVVFRNGDVLLMCDASWNYPAWIAVRRAREEGARVVLLVYDLIPITHPQFCYRLTSLIFANWLKKMMPVSDAAICISKATRDELAKWLPRNTQLDEPPLGFFHLGADVGAPAFASERLRTFFDQGSAHFVSVGSIEPRKNHAQLLQVLERLWAEGSQARLMIAGKPTVDCQAFVERLRKHPEQGARLLTLFDATDGEIRYAYSRCNALMFPSLAEGFGLPLVEARACGCRVIASDLAVFREFADEQVRFFKAGSASALEEALRDELSSAPRDQAVPAELLSWEGSGAQFVQVMRHLLAP